jgi:hypothetical protein
MSNAQMWTLLVVSPLVAILGPWLNTLTKGKSPGWLNILAGLLAFAGISQRTRLDLYLGRQT